MNQRQLEICSCLRQLTSENALLWLMANFPSEEGNAVGEAIFFMTHRSWKKREQIKLFKEYFHKSFPLGKNSVCAFSKVMPPRLLAKLLEEFVENDLASDRSKLELAGYRLQAFLAENKCQPHSEDLRKVLGLVNAKLAEVRNPSSKFEAIPN